MIHPDPHKEWLQEYLNWAALDDLQWIQLHDISLITFLPQIVILTTMILASLFMFPNLVKSKTKDI